MIEEVVIVTGSRVWADIELLGSVLAFHDPGLVVQGGARGADEIALRWADENNRTSHTIPADWKRLGKCAGSVRNIRMLVEYPGALVLAFPMPMSIGTWHCIREAQRRRHRVIITRVVDSFV